MSTADTDIRTINRREAVRRIALLMGGAMVGSRYILSGQPIPMKVTDIVFTDADKALMDEIGETIIPATSIPGAKAAGIGAFMARQVNDCYDDKEHAIFKEGLTKINDAATGRYGKSFLECSAEQRTAVCNALDAEQKAYKKTKGEENPVHYFKMMKELTVLGYFSSEIGCTQAVRYLEVPGAYHGDVPYKKGDKVWFSS
jgi:hypothetical protein